MSILKKIRYFLLFAIINIPLFRPICILHIFGKKKIKNQNKHILIGLRKSYSVYKIRDRFTAFLFFLLVMAAICDFYCDRDIATDISDTFDLFLGPFTFIQRLVL